MFLAFPKKTRLNCSCVISILGKRNMSFCSYLYRNKAQAVLNLEKNLRLVLLNKRLYLTLNYNHTDIIIRIISFKIVIKNSNAAHFRLSQEHLSIRRILYVFFFYKNNFIRKTSLRFPLN